MADDKPAPSGLEAQLQALLAVSSDIDSGAKAASKDAKKIRRKSRDLEEQFEGMSEGAKEFKALASLGSTNSDEDIKKIFQEIDADGNGTLDVDEVKQAFKKVNITKTEDEVKALFKSVKDEKSEAEDTVTLDEFMKIMKQ